MAISIVVAVAGNGVIGRNGKLPWRLPADLRHFRSITMGKPIVMGRLTHESIGRPLPGRKNIVVTRNREYRAEGCCVIHGPGELAAALPGTVEVMIIGGAGLYADMLPLANRLYMTEVHAKIEGDVCFPEFDRRQWQEAERQFHRADGENEYDYSFVRLVRKHARGDASGV